MKKQLTTRIISGLIVLVFVVSAFQIPRDISQAASASMTDYYSNPNQDLGNSPYRFKVSSVINSNLLTSVIGCTGVVNKVATWMSTMLQSPLKVKQKIQDEIATKRKQLEDACSTVKAGTQAAGDSIPTIGGLSTSISTGLETKKLCQNRIKIMSDDMIQKMIDDEKATTARDYKEQCFDGIAITLARNQLVSMTRSAMNWVNSGYGGNPFFVQNMRNFTNAIEQNVIETGIDVLLAPDGKQSPYATDFAQSLITSRNIVSSSANFLGGLQSSLENFIADPQSYYTNDQLNSANKTRTAVQRAQDANNTFSNSFMSGGWNGWLAFTQSPQNNPLGFNMVANQYLADLETQQVQEKKEELTQNNGFLSQKTCIKWQIYDANDKPKTKKGASLVQNGVAVSHTNDFVFSTTEPFVKKLNEDGHGKCVDWKITTPGSIIKEKTSNYLNSPERQLELAKTINDSLNALFTVLISKLENGGLSGLSDSVVTTNWTDTINRSSSEDGSSSYDNSGAYDGFNLTKDLGNTYIHEDVIELGTWNANTNKITTNDKTTNGNKLYPDMAPISNGETAESNSYYKVSVAGNTKLVQEGYNDWSVGDRAFWDGSKWQNWRKDQKSPIKNRGVIQIQQDYIVAAKEILKILPSVMPSLGELDYCLPGPNPSYKTNSSSVQSAFGSWINSSYVGILDSSGKRYGVKIDKEGDTTYNDLINSYPNTTIWGRVKNDRLGSITYNGETGDFSIKNIIEIFSNICNGDHKESLGSSLSLNGPRTIRCTGNYFYDKNNLSRTETDNLNTKSKLKEYIDNFANNYLFDKFYEVFDQKMNSLYFKKMTNQYIEYENRPVSEPNPAYIKMAESGFSFTKDIVSYSEDITQAEKDYTDAITQAKVNIAKLEPIKEEVSKIIKAAQNRRDANLITILNNEAKRTGGTVLTEAAYKKKYASCLDEENISVFDVEDIVGVNEKRSEEACSDGVDNDLDGLVDSKDPDCGTVTTINPPNVEVDTTADNY